MINSDGRWPVSLPNSPRDPTSSRSIPGSLGGGVAGSPGEIPRWNVGTLSVAVRVLSAKSFSVKSSLNLP